MELELRKEKGKLSKLMWFLREVAMKRFLARMTALILRKWSYPLFGIPSGLVEVKQKANIFYPETKVIPKNPVRIDPSLFWMYRDQKHLQGKGGVVVLPNAMATNRGGNLAKSGKLITNHLAKIDGRPHHRHNLFRFSAQTFFPKIYKTDKPILNLTAHCQRAFYHWIHEVLPRLHLAEINGFAIEKVFVDTHLHYQKESLELMGLRPEQILSADTYDAVQSPQLTVPFSPELATNWGCDFLRKRILPKLRREKKRRIYVTRRDAVRRRVLNEDEITPLLEKYGFEVVEMSGRSMKEQMEVFYGAEAVIGPHGAGFAHLVFCDPGTPFVEFFAPAYVNLSYWHIAEHVGLPYAYLFGKGARYPDGYDPHIDPDMEIDPKDLEATLKLMGL